MDVVRLLREILQDEPAVELVALFGSCAAGRARPSSDVDLGILWSADVPASARDAVLNRIERAVRATVDPIDLEDAPPLLRMEIARTGAVVVERSPGIWTEFRARAMLDWWDFAPYARRMHEAARARLLGAARDAR